MDNKTPQNRKATYTGRSGSPASGAQKRPAASSRARSAGAQAGPRPTGFAHAAPERRRAAAQPAEAKTSKRSIKLKLPKLPKREKPQKPLRNKRTQGKSAMPSWQKLLLIGVPALIALIVLLALIFGGNKGTYHQLPKVERDPDAVFSPEETIAPEGTSGAPAIDAEAAFSDAAFADNSEGFFGGSDTFADGAEDLFGSQNAFDDSASANDLDAFGDFGDLGSDQNLDDAALLEQLIALDEANA